MHVENLSYLWKDIVHVEVGLHLTLMFIHTSTSLDKIDEILALSSLGGTYLVSCPSFWVGCCRLGLILFQLYLPYLLSWSWVNFGFTIHLPMRLALSLLDDATWIQLCHSFCLRDLPHLCMVFPMDFALSSTGKWLALSLVWSFSQTWLCHCSMRLVYLDFFFRGNWILHHSVSPIET